jgi:anti-sigma regulatory factor (Ser/Thr protein kinase)
MARTLQEAGVEESRRFEALLVTSELVTNALSHGSRPGDEISVDVSLEGERLLIGVRDAARGGSTPVALTPDEQRPSGRGLAMVDWLADWSERIVDGRREVRAELTI